MRKLASIQKIWDITPIEGADRIELAHVEGWQSVVIKALLSQWIIVCTLRLIRSCQSDPNLNF